MKSFNKKGFSPVSSDAYGRSGAGPGIPLSNGNLLISHFSMGQRAMLASSFKTRHYRKFPSLQPVRQWEAHTLKLEALQLLVRDLGQPPNHPDYTTDRKSPEPPDF